VKTKKAEANVKIKRSDFFGIYFPMRNSLKNTP
jgi:hypothetical protein